MTAAALVAELEDRLRSRVVAAESAWWSSAVDAGPETERRRTETDLAVSDILADAETFAALRAALAETRTDTAADPLVTRQLEVLHD